jgi:hypothetical protein
MLRILRIPEPFRKFARGPASAIGVDLNKLNGGPLRRGNQAASIYARRSLIIYFHRHHLSR